MGAPGTRVILALCACIGGSRLGHTDGRLQQPRANPPNQQDCTLSACLQPGPPPTTIVGQDRCRPSRTPESSTSECRASGHPVRRTWARDRRLDADRDGQHETSSVRLCPVTAPTNGAPCAPAVNTIACIYSIETCFCTTDWICF